VITPMTTPLLTLNDGHTIPQLGFGVFQVPPPETEATVLAAIDAGYRHIDTAQMYGNEAGVGAAVRTSGLGRDDVYITSKLNNGFHRPDDARRSFDRSLEALGMEYVDLFLIHWPLPTLYDGDFVSTWQTLIEFRNEGRARSIGVSNFHPDHLARLRAETDVIPAVNQIEVHPQLTNEAARAASLAQGTLVEAWSPIGRGRILDDPDLSAIAARAGHTVAQTILRWHLQRGDIIFPKSMHPERMRENIAIFDFTLSDDDMAAISAFDRGEAGRIGPNPDTFAWIPE